MRVEEMRDKVEGTLKKIDTFLKECTLSGYAVTTKNANIRLEPFGVCDIFGKNSCLVVLEFSEDFQQYVVGGWPGLNFREVGYAEKGHYESLDDAVEKVSQLLRGEEWT
jgi:hypothetical protein